MPKREAASTGFECPGCQSKFDPETHVPFMGSCGHSLCAICVNEQKIKICPACNMPKGFMWKLKNDLAIGLLGALRRLDVKKFDRSAPTDFKCSDCHSKFDSESHAPFVGSCGHSRCSYCVNDKDIKTCSVCKKRRGFAWKQRNVLAAEILATFAPLDVKKPKLYLEQDVYAPDEPVPAILDPNNRAFLVNIVNQLDPLSFLKLSATCKPLHNYCFNSKEVKIIYGIMRMKIGAENGVFGFKLENYLEKAKFHRYVPVNYVGYGCGFLGSMVNRKKLRNYPVVFKIAQLDFDTAIDSDILAKTRSLLAEFPVCAIWDIRVDENVTDWEGFIQFLKDFHIGEVHTVYGSKPITIPDEAAAYLLQNTESFCGNFKISESLLFEASVPDLCLGPTLISKKVFLNLVKKIANSTSELNWTIGSNDSFGHYGCFHSLPVDYNGPLPSERPLTFYMKDELEIFWVLREDGKYLRCWDKDGKIEFLTTSNRDVPSELLPNNNPYYDSDYWGYW